MFQNHPTLKQFSLAVLVGGIALLTPVLFPVAAFAADPCATAMQTLQKTHQEAVASGKASARQIEQSSTYLRRLNAWWKMDAGNPTLQASCTAIAAGLDAGDDGDYDDAEEDVSLNDEEFDMIMRQFDAAGVPR